VYSNLRKEQTTS